MRRACRALMAAGAVSAAVAMPAAAIPKEILMRILALAILAIGAASAAVPAQAQTYDPRYPVCLHVHGRGISYYECTYNSLPQCNMSASGRSAQCVVNPYFAHASQEPSARRYKRYRNGY
jgi:hypothetical protein